MKEGESSCTRCLAALPALFILTKKFHIDPERRFAVLLEDGTTTSPQVEEWMKPARRQLQIEWGAGQSYEPGFVVEAADEKWLVESKRHDEIDDKEVQAKVRAATRWCEYATDANKDTYGSKFRCYLLIRDDLIISMVSLS